MKAAIIIVAALLLPVPAIAEDQQFSNRQLVSLQPDKAYFLAHTYEMDQGGLRGTVKVVPVLIRVLSEEELQQAKELFDKDPETWKDKAAPNVVVMLADAPYDRPGKGEDVLLTAATPGTYILGGISLTNWATKSAGMMVASLCMGSVKFEARPGAITDLGTIVAARDDQPTTIPELAKIVRGKPSDLGVWPYSVAIRPSPTAVPDTLRDLPRIPAEYRAVSAFPNYAGAPISRLAPLQGVLDYDKDGEVIDLKAKP